MQKVSMFICINSKKNTGRNNRVKNRVKPKKKGGQKKNKQARVTMSPYARMLADPCNAELVPGMHGPNNGYLSRMKKFVTMGQNYNAATNNANCGYIIWCPRFHTPGNGTVAIAPSGPMSYSNAFIWLANNSSTVPTNSLSSTSTSNSTIYGSDKANNTALPFQSTYSIPDPACDFVAGNLVQDARLISACMKVTYLGTMNASDGQFCYIKNVPLQQFLEPTDNGEVPRGNMSVDRCFELADQCGRLGLETHEVRYRVSGSDADRFVGADDNGVAIGVVNSGTSPNLIRGQVSQVNDAIELSNPNVIGFAFRGFTNGQLAKLSIEMYKNFEWRPNASSGVTTPAVKQLGASKLASAETWLDRYMPSWETVAGSVNQHNISRLVSLVATGYDAARGVGLGTTYAPRRLTNGGTW